MKRIISYGLVVWLAVATAAVAAENFDDAIKRATLDYAARLRTAGEDLNRSRERIATEKEPLLKALRAAEDRIIAAESTLIKLDTGRETAGTDRKALLKDFDTLRKNITYITTLAHDGFKALATGLAPGEEQSRGREMQVLQQKLEDTSSGPPLFAALDAADYMAARTERLLGGDSVPGESMLAEDNRVVKGTFAFVGPETFFRDDQATYFGTVRSRAAGDAPIAYRLPQWDPADAKAFFSGQLGRIVADASAGKALRLRQTSGTWLEHVRKGGVVAYAILGVGAVALVLIVLKLRDVSRMRVESRAEAAGLLGCVAAGSWDEAEKALKNLHRTTREVFETGLRHRREPKALLEERLQAVLLGQRLYFERRLPLLAVIATAAPLMGLLGTVVGMVKTFALITVFGTGNAGKLSSGISEVLVATELGLAVAIPSLVIHGFLAHRIHKNLSLLERHALEFVTANEIARMNLGEIRSKESVPV